MNKYETLRNDIIQYAERTLGKNHFYTFSLTKTFDSLSDDDKKLFEVMSDEQLDRTFLAYADLIKSMAQEK